MQKMYIKKKDNVKCIIAKTTKRTNNEGFNKITN